MFMAIFPIISGEAIQIILTVKYFLLRDEEHLFNDWFTSILLWIWVIGVKCCGGRLIDRTNIEYQYSGLWTERGWYCWYWSRCSWYTDDIVWLRLIWTEIKRTEIFCWYSANCSMILIILSLILDAGRHDKLLQARMMKWWPITALSSVFWSNWPIRDQVPWSPQSTILLLFSSSISCPESVVSGCDGSLRPEQLLITQV